MDRMNLYTKNFLEKPVLINNPDKSYRDRIPIICTEDYLTSLKYWCDQVGWDDMYCWEEYIIDKINRNEDGLFDFSKDIIDIGAGIGEYCWLTNFNHAYAFEPCKSIRFLLEANVLMQGKVDKVDVFDCGISDQNTVKFFDGWSLDNIAEKQSEIIGDEKSKTLTAGDIQLRTLDSFNFNNVGLIKIDIEGHELEAIQGAIGTIIRNDYPPILIEIWTPDVYIEHQGEAGAEKREKLLKLIDDLGYDIDWWYGDWETYLCVHRSQKNKKASE